MTSALSYLRKIGAGFVKVVEYPFSRHGAQLAFFAVATALTTSGWLRPPLTEDVSALSIPVGIISSDELSPEAMLYGPVQFRVGTVGVILAILIALATTITLWRPTWFSASVGVLLAATIAANAAVVLNHPAVIELLDNQYEQRRQMVEVLDRSPEPNSLTDNRNGRIGASGIPAAGEQRSDLRRGWVYLRQGPLLVVWIGLGLLLGKSGALRYRLGSLMGWLLCGLILAVAVCLPRLRAEYDWLHAKRCEKEYNHERARDAIEKAIVRFPEFSRLERTWLLAGKSDYMLGKASPANVFFLAYQLARAVDRPQTVTHSEDLPWLIAHVSKHDEGRAATLFGSDQTQRHEQAGTAQEREGQSTIPRRFRAAFKFARRTEQQEAIALMEALLATDAGRSPAVRQQAARFWTDGGLAAYLRWPVFREMGLDYGRQDRQLSTAVHAWHRAAELAPEKLDIGFYTGLVNARLAPDRPEKTEEAFAPVLERLSDRALRADMLASLGDSYLRAGDVATARLWYARSFDLLNLPRKKNYRAQYGLGGL